MSDFSLPPLEQDQFSTYYGRKLDRSDGASETVVYPGIQLKCSTKSRQLKKHIQPRNVFITKIEREGEDDVEYSHKLYGNDNQWTVLPKRLYSVCFPKIHLGSIPDNNRITLQLTDNIYCVLPYVPDEFYKQKQQKAHRPSKPVTRRNKRARVSSEESSSEQPYSGWGVYGMSVPEPNTISKDDLMTELRSIMDEIHRSSVAVKNPFSGCDDLNKSEDAKAALNTIAQFVYHYAREELRMQPVRQTHSNEPLWDNIKDTLH